MEGICSNNGVEDSCQTVLQREVGKLGTGEPTGRGLEGTVPINAPRRGTGTESLCHVLQYP